MPTVGPAVLRMLCRETGRPSASGQSTEERLPLFCTIPNHESNAMQDMDQIVPASTRAAPARLT